MPKAAATAANTLRSKPFDHQILACGRIVTHQEAASDGPIVMMSNGNIGGIKHLCTSPANHRVPSFFRAGLKITAIVVTAKSE